jgi:molecular chaperone Hsp33
VTDDLVAPFSLDNAPVRGRIARLGAGSLDCILQRHDYPRPVAMLLGEALTLAALVGSLLKADGRLVVQAQGEGLVPLLVAEHGAGVLRGYARLAEGAHAKLANENRLPPAELLGAGSLALTLDLGDDTAPYQGMVTLAGDTLAQCAETYFRVSEQTDTGILLAVGQVMTRDAPPLWRSGGALMQRVAGDRSRGETEEDWNRASILFATATDEELIDPALPADRLLYRLFHEEGARMGEASALDDRCSCNESRLAGLMRQFPRASFVTSSSPTANCTRAANFALASTFSIPKR